MPQQFSLNDISKKIAVIGIGNTLRSDDGIGAHICRLLDEMQLTCFTTFIVQQLHVELIEDLIEYDLVILVDASVTGNDIALTPVTFNETQTITASHHLNAQMFGALSRKIFGTNVPILLCSVKGENFEFGESLSVFADNNTTKAITLIFDSVSKLLQKDH
jgi:hydrogenase maturation protease